jgi:cytochrome c nitrite reductase small subunit
VASHVSAYAQKANVELAAASVLLVHEIAYRICLTMKFKNFFGVLLAVSLGLAIGLGAYTFYYGQGGAYLTNDPKACMNCHVMSEQYNGWIKSSHKAVATCNDCHAPKGIIAKYISKSQNGFWHSFAFTTGHFKDNIQIKPHNLAIVEQNCRDCHQNIIHSIEQINRQGNQQASCVACHAGIGHMK